MQRDGNFGVLVILQGIDKVNIAWFNINVDYLQIVIALCKYVI